MLVLCQYNSHSLGVELKTVHFGDFLCLDIRIALLFNSSAFLHLVGVKTVRTTGPKDIFALFITFRYLSSNAASRRVSAFVLVSKGVFIHLVGVSA